MLEIPIVSLDELNTKDRITIDLIKDGEQYLNQFNVNQEILLEAVSIVYKYLRVVKKIPHDLYKFFVASYYIIERHPYCFPVHESKKDFCKRFGIQESSLNYSVEKIVKSLQYVKIQDDLNFPYFIDPKSDICFNLIKNIVNKKVKKAMMRFLLYDKPINAQILTEELVEDIIYNHEIFPEELFRQLYWMVFDLVDDQLEEYNEYVALQKRFFL